MRTIRKPWRGAAHLADFAGFNPNGLAIFRDDRQIRVFPHRQIGILDEARTRGLRAGALAAPRDLFGG